MYKPTNGKNKYKKIEKEIYKYFWLSKTEPVKREIIRNSHRLGGWNLFNLEIFETAVQIAQIISTLSINSHPLATALQFFIGPICNKFTNNKTHFPFLLNCDKTTESWQKTLHVLNSSQNFNCKQFLKNPRPVFIYHLLRQPQHFNLKFHFPVVWTRLLHSSLPPDLIELNWKTAHSALPTKVKLYRWKRFKNEKCLFCDANEDIIHLFCKCWISR